MSDWLNSLWGASDKYHFSWSDIEGDFLLRARVKFTGRVQDPHSHIGWKLRANGEATGAFLNAGIYGDGRATLHFSPAPHLPSEEIELPLRGADIIQLERRGSCFVFSVAIYGAPFISRTLPYLDLGIRVSAGLFYTPQDPEKKEPVLTCDLRVCRPPKEGYVPYTDYIGSRLEILEVFTGKLLQIHGAPEPFEAPNWMPDGRTLIYNISGQGSSKGLLRSFNLDTRREAPLDTGFAIRNNNDHVLSFDGQQLAISHHAEEDDGRSVIYTLPSTGGSPKRVTPKSPSYLHGWSPDAQWLVYTGGRSHTADGPLVWDIYKIPVEGGEEVRLTHGEGLNDGPEFSPDGKHIYFNSTRSGRMQLWRMRPDGLDLEQLTDDDFNNWFPHLSPNGKWIAFLSYGPEVQAKEHPYYKQVYIRLMSAQGSKPCIVAYLFGGQGTINVPSWSPDGTRIAFVSNTA